MEHFFVCPYCGERISMVLDTSVKGQTYVEDCEVCCQPIEVRYTVKDDEVRQFEARAPDPGDHHAWSLSCDVGQAVV